MSLEAEEKIIVAEFQKPNCEEYFKRIVNKSAKTGKSTQKSIKYRKDGNNLFGKKDHGSKAHEKIWKLYTNSIALAVRGSEELGTGYSNRSALLIHLKKYEECLDDIERALKLTTADTIKVKLYCRQAECYVALQEGNKKRNAIEKAKYWFKKIEESNKNKNVMAEMIKKTENVIKENKPDLEHKRKSKELTCKNDAFYISFIKQYGRCLMAKRDIKPGEIVCQEKFYVASPNDDKMYAYCSHCLAISWASVPCDSCSMYMYCSEKCREEAWSHYHDIECLTKMERNLSKDYYTQMSLRSVIMGIREAGSIKKLKNMVNDVDKCTDNIKKGYAKNGEFSSISFKSLYSLQYYKSTDLTEDISCALKALIALAQNSTIFGKTYDWEDISDMTRDDNICFIGALLLRLVFIFNTNAFHVLDPTVDCKYKLNSIECALNACCPRGLSFSPVAALMNHSCDNNVGKIFDNNGQVVYYALQPIKKDTQLYTSYYCHYTKLSKSERQEILNSNYYFDCDCTPCKENWPESHYPNRSDGNKKASRIPEFNQMICQEVLLKNDRLIKSLRIKDRTYKERTLRKFIEDVEKLHKHTKHPSFHLEEAIRILQALFRGCHGVQLRIPKECKS